MSEVIAKRLSIASGVVLAAAAVFLYGFSVERYQVWPYHPIHDTMNVVKSIRTYGEVVPVGRRVDAPAAAPRERFSIEREGLVTAGYYVFTGWNDDAGLYGAWLYDQDGGLVHTWHFDYAALDPDGPWNGADHPHPVYPLEDGSLVVAFDSGDVLARLDTCSEPMWIKHGIYHHSLARADDGSFWIWRGDGTPYGHYHYAENFDAATGDTIREIALVEDVIQKAGDLSAIFAVRPDFPFRHFEKTPVFLALNDIFHPNDIEPLSAELAPLFPDFEAGDLLMSFRNIDLVAVLDPDTARVKWWSQGPWRAQHDPDFAPDGTISVFDNDPARLRSEIIKMDPTTRTFRNELFDGEVRFHTETMGKHQYLPDGNLLIVVPDEGRILEVTAGGNKVMEFNNIVAGQPAFNDHVEDGMWVPPDYFETVPVCTEQAQ